MFKYSTEDLSALVVDDIEEQGELRNHDHFQKLKQVNYLCPKIEVSF
jgi:hypothetical protein